MLFRAFARSGRLAAVEAAAVAAAVLAAGAVTCAGCGSASSGAGSAAESPAVIVVHDNANGTTVKAKAGDRIELVLSSNYWEVAASPAPRVLRQDGPTVLLARPSSCPSIPGLGCTPVRTDFTALAGGTAVIKASRTSCGEARACQPDQTRFTVTIVVRGQSLPAARSSPPFLTTRTQRPRPLSRVTRGGPRPRSPASQRSSRR